MNRWREHFEVLLNTPTPLDPPEILAADRDLPIESSLPSKEDVRKEGIESKLFIFRHRRDKKNDVIGDNALIKKLGEELFRCWKLL